MPKLSDLLREQEEVERNFLNYCKPCINFVPVDDTRGLCRLCNCPLSTEVVFGNKLAYKFLACPIGEWK